MSSLVSMKIEIRELKKRLAVYERMHENQINPPVSVVNVDYKEKFEAADKELQRFKPLPLTGRRLYRKEK